MRKVINKVKTIITLGAMLASFAIFNSCAQNINKTNTNAETKTKVKVLLSDESIVSARTILPAYSSQDLSEIKLFGLPEASEEELSSSLTPLAQWNSYNSFLNDEGVGLESGNWNFLLTALSNGSVLTAESGLVSVNADSVTQVSFNLQVKEGDTKGSVEISLLKLEELRISSAKYLWGSELIDDEESAESLEVETDFNYERSALFRKTSIDEGNYYISLYFYDDDGKLVMPAWTSSVIVKAGAKSSFVLNASDLNVTLNTYQIKYFANNGDEKLSETKTFWPLSEIPDLMFTEAAPAGKKFRGWNTKADGSGTRYSPGDNPAFSDDTSLYAQWCTYDSEKDLYSIQDLNDFRAFFSYSENAARKYSKGVKAELAADILSIENWLPAKFYGSLNGNNHTISYTLESSVLSAEYLGLFSELYGSASDLIISDLDIQVRNSSSNLYMGALAGQAYEASASNIKVKNSSLKSPRSVDYVGGLFGISSYTYTEGIKITGTEEKAFTVSGNRYIGGISGSCYDCSFGTEENPDQVSYANITGSVSDYYGYGAGAFVGECYKTTFVNPEVYYTSVSGYLAGGIIGSFRDYSSTDSEKIKNPKIVSDENNSISGYLAGGIVSVNKGVIENPVLENVVLNKISFANYAWIGGITGKNEGIISGDGETVNLKALKLEVEGTEYAGGVAGLNKEGASITGIVLDSSSVVKAKTRVGGICGQSEGSIKDVTVAANVIATAGCAGGIACNNFGTIDADKVNLVSAKVEVTFTGSEVDAGGVAALNGGLINKTLFTGSVTAVPGEEAGCIGGIAGSNGDGRDGYKGTISNCEVKDCVVKSSLGHYTGGIAGYNFGGSVITGDNKITSMEFEGNTETVGAFISLCGYVVGKNEGTVSNDIENALSETTSFENVTIDGTTNVYEIVLPRTSKVTVTVTLAEGSGPVSFALVKSPLNTYPSAHVEENSLAYYENLSEGEASVCAGYLENGTYYLTFHENVVETCTAAIISYDID